jgi:hexosaminidase
MRGSTGLPVRDADRSEDAGISLRVDESDDTLLAGPDDDRSESFRLVVDSDHVEVVGGGAAGVFYGVQAVLQLLPADVYRKGRVGTGPWTIPAQQVEDAPAFAWRGVMLDVARHFRTKAEVLRVIDQLAAHRVNRLHFHLTEDQGWRIEIRKYPRLTEIGSWRAESQVGAHVEGPDGILRPDAFDGRPHGGYYTQDDIREIVAYATDL